MTSGERAVWAAAFVQTRTLYDATRSAERARWMVGEMYGADRSGLSDEARAMLDDMLGTGADRTAFEIEHGPGPRPFPVPTHLPGPEPR